MVDEVGDRPEPDRVRLSRKWRWSLVSRGGPYPLLRIAARFLKTSHRRIMIGCRTVPDGYTILCHDPNIPEEPDAWGVLAFTSDDTLRDVRARIVGTLGP